MQSEPGGAKSERLTGPERLRRRQALEKTRGWGGVVANPRNTVLLVLAAVLGLGGGRLWWRSIRARRAVDRLADPDVSAEEVANSARYGREGLMELFRLLETAPTPAVREAAGSALAALWRQDQLIPEEEKGIVRRGFSVDWKARRRYPRGLQVPIPIVVSYGVPFLREGGEGVAPSDLEWSHGVVNAGRAALETFSPWTKGSGRVAFEVEPGDFAGNGPHRLVLQSKVRTAGLTSSWELELPQIPFGFEFDPLLSVEALLTLPDDARGDRISRSIRLESPGSDGAEPRFLAIGPDLAIRNPPEIVVESPLPSDLAHRVRLEFDGTETSIPAGDLILGGQATRTTSESVRVPLGLSTASNGLAPGEHRVRAVLTADPGLGWADPDVRSVWPGSIATGWTTVAVIRR